MQPTRNNVPTNPLPMMVPPRETAPQVPPQGRILGLGPLTGQLPMVQPLLWRPVTSMMPMTALHPNSPSVPRMPASLPSVINARFPSVQTMPLVPLPPSSITVTRIPPPTEPPYVLTVPRMPDALPALVSERFTSVQRMPSAPFAPPPNSSMVTSPYVETQPTLASLPAQTPATCKEVDEVFQKHSSRPITYVRTCLEALPYEGAHSNADRELATFICDPRISIPGNGYSPGQGALSAFTLACNKNYPMTVLALMDKSGLSDNVMAKIIHNSDSTLPEDVSLPGSPGNGCCNALHVACEHAFENVMKLLITKFAFRRDLPRYDGVLPEDIIRNSQAMVNPNVFGKRSAAHRMIALLRTSIPTTNPSHYEEESSEQFLQGSNHPSKRQKTSHVTAPTSAVAHDVLSTEAPQSQEDMPHPPASYTITPFTPLPNDGVPDDPFSDLFL